MNVRLLFWRARGLVGRIIEWRTCSPWGHVAVYLSGITYEYTWPCARATDGLIKCDAERCFREEIPYEKVAAIRRYWLDAIKRGKRYNWIKLAALLFIYPTRWVWDRLNWVPFSSRFWGEVCSTGVDESFKCARIDLVPHAEEGYTSPGDLWDSPLLKEYK